MAATAQPKMASTGSQLETPQRESAPGGLEAIPDGSPRSDDSGHSSVWNGGSPSKMPCARPLSPASGHEERKQSKRRASVARRKSIQKVQSNLEADHQKYNADYHYNGLFIDYLVRARANQRAGLFARALLDPKPGHHNDGEDIVKMEKLIMAIRRLIVYHNKQEGVPEFLENKNVKQHFWAIVNLKRDALKLNTDVDNHLLMHNLKMARGREMRGEDPEERKGRLGKFWLKYHNSHQTIDLRLASTGSGHLPLGTGFGGKYWPRPDDLTSPKNVHIDEWKLRTTRGKRPWPSGFVAANQAEVGFRAATPQRIQIPNSTSAAGISASSKGGTSPSAVTSPSTKGGTSPSKRQTMGRKTTRRDTTSIFGSRASWRAATPPPPSSSSSSEEEYVAPIIPKRVNQALGEASLPMLSMTAANGRGKTLEFGKSAKTMTKAFSASAPTLLPTMMTSHLRNGVGEDSLFTKPHTRKKLDHKNPESGNSPTDIYIRACADNSVSPNLLPFCTGDSVKLIASGQALSDHKFCAITEMCGKVKTIEEVDLDGNASLTERSLVPFLQHLFGPCAQSCLHRLTLAHCLRNATGPGIREVMGSMTQLLTHGVKKLQFLDLSGIKIGLDTQEPLCEAISNHTTLSSVVLSDVGLGRNPQVLKCLTELCGSSTITALDIGWNAFTKIAFSHFGEKLCKAGIVKKLSVSNCAGAVKNGNNPIDYFLEHLIHPGALTKLDISVNRIDFRGALVLEASCEKNKVLSDLDISYNPLGSLGYRSLLRLLCRESSALNFFVSEDCANGSLSQAAEEGFQIFCAVRPIGKYILNLTRPYSRALLHMLYKTCERFKLEPSEAFTKVTTLSPPAFVHAVKDLHGCLQLPMQGKIEVTFDFEGDMSNVSISDGDFSGFLEHHYRQFRVSIPPSKQVPLMALWKIIEGKQVDQIAVLDALSKDFVMNYSQFEQLTRSQNIVNEIAFKLLPCILGGDATRYMTLLHMPSYGTYLKVYRQAVRLCHFNIDNPTGHYELDLANCCDFSIAERLVLLDTWECCVQRKREKENVSQTGVVSQARNTLYQGKVLFGVACIAEFNMPEFGTLEFDYVSARRPPTGAQPIRQDAWDHILAAVYRGECSAADKVEALTMLSHWFYLTCLQMRELIGLFKDHDVRAELLVRFFLRLVDIHNEKIIRSRFESVVEFQHLQSRLGHTTYFPFIQPEQASFELDLAVHDQRLAFHILLTIAAKEGRDHLRDYSLVHPDGTLENFTAGMPRSWDIYERIPKGGIFRAKYNCAPEDRSYSERAKLLQKYGFWTPPEDEKQVMWWSSIAECPIDVVEFVQFIYTKYRCIWKVFKMIDGEDGNGQITLQEFTAGLETLKCTKFNGKDKQQRIVNVFRYLDPSGEGQVSEGEWGILEQLFDEIQLSIKEFVDFCERIFGDDLLQAWHEIDKDGGGDIDREEWNAACEELGFFGLVQPIFDFLDQDDEGTVSLQEFRLLESFQAKYGSREGSSVGRGGLMRRFTSNSFASSPTAARKSTSNSFCDSPSPSRQLSESPGE